MRLGVVCAEPVRRGAAAATLLLSSASLAAAAEAVEPSLDPDAGATDEVVITVTRRERPTLSSSRISSRDISSIPRRTAEDVLSLVPGLTLVQHGSEGKGHQFFLRGFDAVHGADMELTLDGVPVNEWSNVHAQGYIDLGFVVPEVIASVDVTKGPFNIEQGAFAMAGSAAYELGVPLTDRGLKVSYTLGNTWRHRGLLTYSPTAGDGGDFIAIEGLEDAGFGQNRGIRRGAVLGRVRLFDSPTTGTLSAFGSAYSARFDLPGALRSEDVDAGRIGFYDTYDPTSEGRSDRALLAVVYALGDSEHGLHARSYFGYRRLELLENFTGYLLDPVAGDRREQRHESWNVGFDMTGSVRLASAWRLGAGAGARADMFDQHQDHVGAFGERLERERELSALQALGGARVALDWRPSAGLRFVGGARVDLASITPEQSSAPGAESPKILYAVSPRLRVEARPALGTAVFFSYGRGFRPPEARALSGAAPERTGITEDLYIGGDPTMTQTHSFELGGRWQDATRVIGVGMTTFVTFVQRESIYDHVSGITLELNATRRIGAELELSSHPFEWLALSADASWVDARFVGSDNPIPLVPPLAGGGRATLGRELGARAGLRVFALAPRPLPHGARGATLLGTEATLGYHWPSFWLDAELENLLDLELREGEYHYASAWRPGEPASQLPVLHYVAGPPFTARLSLTASF